MKNQINYFEQSMDDIVFENRNKQYGAYKLRISSSRNIRTGMLTVLFLVSALAVYILTRKIPVEKIKEQIITFTDIKQYIPPLIEPEIVQPAVQTATVHQAAVRNPEVRVVENTQPAELPPTVDELNGKTIGSENIDGPEGPVNPIAAVSTVTTVTTTATSSNTANGFVLIAEQMPVFDNFARYLQNTIRYPRQAVDVGAEGKVYVEFIVNTDGSISDAKVVRGIGFGCDEEALGAIRNMPKWKPARQQGNPVRVKLTLPVEFKLNK